MDEKLLRKALIAVGNLYMDLNRDEHFKHTSVSYSKNPRNVAKSPIAKKLQAAYMEMDMQRMLMKG